MPNSLFLATLPEEDRARLEPHLKPVTLEPYAVISRAGAPIKTVYFPLGTISSLVVVSERGDSVEAALVGVEGVTAFPDVVRRGVAIHNAIIQGPGEALGMDADAFRSEFERHGGLYKRGIDYMQYLLAQTCQNALCNRAHSIDQRLAKWLLLCSDAIQSDELDLTQEFMATMLGVHRPGVTQAATALKEAESIDYARGHLRITNRRLLEGFACECYAFLRNQRDKFLKNPL